MHICQKSKVQNHFVGYFWVFLLVAKGGKYGVKRIWFVGNAGVVLLRLGL